MRRTPSVGLALAAAPIWAFIWAFIWCSSAPPALADESMVTVDVDLHSGVPVDSLGNNLYGFGVGGTLGVELHLIPQLGIHGGFLGTWYSTNMAPRETEWLGGRLGVRWHFGELFTLGADHHDAWIGAHANFGRSGGLARPGFDIDAGFDFGLVGELRMGPFIRYQFGSDPNDRNVSMIQFGLHVAFVQRPVERGADGDADGDGVADDDDACPSLAAGDTPNPDRAGCPQGDSDGDGIDDGDDACPTVHQGEQPDGDRRGCPADGDGDGVIDELDNCPTVAGTETNQGCGIIVSVTSTEQVELTERIPFARRRATVTPRARRALRGVAATLNDHPEITEIVVEGHIDASERSASLAERRANAVIRELVRLGVEESRLTPRTYGSDRPHTPDPSSRRERRQNQRVEFNIVGVQ